ncbi:MAG: ferrous iron transport protein B [Myxococcales bacterium]|nr:ferrous iron transport protein B [Myxococcales bacterium]
MSGAAVIALAGNPNAGKTSLFNRLTGRQGRVGNYPGVTVELLGGTLALPGGGEARIVDVPGSYSLLVRSREEEIAVAQLGLGGGPRPEAIVVCVDATNLLRNLYQVLQLQELGARVVIALTMVDELERGRIDSDALSARLDCPVVPVNAPRGQGLDALRKAIAEQLEQPAPEPRFRWQPSEALATELARVRAALPPEWEAGDAAALWALQCYGGEGAFETDSPAVARAVEGSALSGEAVDDEVIQARYRWLDRELGDLVVVPDSRVASERADRILIHPVWGLLVFIAFMFVLFQSLFAWADPAIGAVEALFGTLAELAQGVLPEGLLADFVIEGLIGGVGSVVVFLPQILLLFFFIGLMEDSGYMARVAYLMDRVMRSMGLHGRAFVPMLSGFACAVPAIMATRTMERHRDRLLTMLVVPLMTCSARLPVYTLIIAALFPAGHMMGVLPIQGTLMIAMYMVSVLTALGAAWVLSKTMLPAPPAALVLELPPYRMPRLADVTRMMWSRTRYFLTEAGTVILACTVVLWMLLSFPRDLDLSRDYEAAIAAAGSNEDAIAALEAEQRGEQLRGSYAGQLGKVIEPVIAPLGFDWKIGIGLIGAFAAREVFVATMGVVYSAGEDVDEESTTLRERMRAEVRADGAPVYTPLVGLSLMVFFALACQCMSTVAVVKRETGGYRWPAFLLAYMTALAWLASFVVYQGGRLLGFA